MARTLNFVNCRLNTLCSKHKSRLPYKRESYDGLETCHCHNRRLAYEVVFWRRQERSVRGRISQDEKQAALLKVV
jgi:hypothetical protein